MKNLKTIILTLLITFFSISSSNSENVRMGAEGGFVFADIRAEETAQR